MIDLDHDFGADLAVSVNGDLLPVSGLALRQQRILRRLLSNPGDYLWQPDYGAGLRQCVGALVNDARVIARIRAQLAQEPGVAASPPPRVTLTPVQAGISVTIQYTDTGSGPTLLTFSTGI